MRTIQMVTFKLKLNFYRTAIGAKKFDFKCIKNPRAIPLNYKKLKKGSSEFN